MLKFLKQLGIALYNNTVGRIVRATKNAKKAAMDLKDKMTIVSVLKYVGYIGSALLFPEAAAFIALFRLLAICDLIDKIADVLFDTSEAMKGA